MAATMSTQQQGARPWKQGHALSGLTYNAVLSGASDSNTRLEGFMEPTEIRATLGTRNMASFSVTPMLIEEALKMPSGHEIVGAEWDFASRTIRLYVEGPDLPIVRQGDAVLNITPTLTRAIGAGGNERWFWSWGLDR